MIRIFLSSILSIIFFLNLPASPTYTNTDWSNSGATIPTLSNAKTISILDFGGKADNNTDNSIALQNAIKSAEGKPTIINIPSGNYTFKKTINIPSNIILKGAGSDKTILQFNLNGNSDLISIQGNLVNNVSSPIISGSNKGSKSIKVKSVDNFFVGDFIQIKQTANHLLASDWAYNYFFQIVRITKINGNEITFENPLRLDFQLSNNPIVQKINPVQNVGIESLKIKRIDASSSQTSNIFFNYAVNCWISGVESESTNYAHITLQSTAFTTISGNYIHDAFNYGDGGKGYGIVLQFGSSDNFIFDNIAKHLRHSFLLQATSNGNIIAYNYSYDPYWTQGFFPTNSAGDIVLHGNFPYANLLEGNIIQNLVIDNSHGINGPDNTFFRNRIENYGIVMNGNSGNDMNFIANEITGSGFLKGLYSLSGNQTEIANNIKGSAQNGSVIENSLINKNYNSKIGVPNIYNSWTNDAHNRNNKTIKTIVKNTSKLATPLVDKEEKKDSNLVQPTKEKKKKTCKLKCKKKKK